MKLISILISSAFRAIWAGVNVYIALSPYTVLTMYFHVRRNNTVTILYFPFLVAIKTANSKKIMYVYI